jgi:hypothetical protein
MFLMNTENKTLEPILRFRNLKLCTTLGLQKARAFSKVEENIFALKTRWATRGVITRASRIAFWSQPYGRELKLQRSKNLQCLE